MFHDLGGQARKSALAARRSLIELALAGRAAAIVTHNVRDLRGGELRLGNLRILTPAQCLEEWQ